MPARFPVNVMSAIIEYLMKNGGTVRDIELYEAIRDQFNISFTDFMKYLMILEIRGYITVSAKETVRVVHLTEYGRHQLE